LHDDSINCITSEAPKANADQSTYSIPAFQDGINERDKAAYPNATTVARAAIESAFVKCGKHVVQDNGDIEITGVVTAFNRGDFWKRFTTVGIDLKATDKKTGSVLWTASLTKRPPLHYDYDYDPARWTPEVADQLVKAVFKESKKQ
jgi:hypothetical protein